tara:strand:- start:320 stop:1060 length:741 start_codon:yes stop_codon:yes gene_type:complete
VDVFNFFSSQWIYAFIINFTLILLAKEFPLLTKPGWYNAGILGTILWGCLGWKGWLSVVIYFLLGSFVTKIGFARKQLAGIAESRGGRRGPENVWGSAAVGTSMAVFISSGIGPEVLFLIGFASSFAAKLSDTFGSEIGKCWGTKTFLITSLKRVPAGTDGGISLEGTIASLIGSLIMTLFMILLYFDELKSYSFIIFISGFIATLLESFVGALFQSKINWLNNETVNCLQTICAAVISILIASQI